jgi:hypothetical protein
MSSSVGGNSGSLSVNVIGQQVHCLIRRPDPFAQCVEKLGPVPAVVARVDHANGFADWKGVDKLQRYVAKLGLCSSARLEE